MTTIVNSEMRKLYKSNMASLPKRCAKWAFDFAAWQPTESQVLKAFQFIQVEEKERIGRYVFKCHAKASLIGRLLIRKFLTENCNIPNNEILLKRDDHGKPFIENLEVKDQVKFSVSHHGNLVVFTGHLSNSEIGIDVMNATHQDGKDLQDFFRLMSRHFSSNEWNIINKVGSSDKMKMFLFNRNWALKESYLKAVGTGISVDLGKIEFKINTIDMEPDSFISDTELFIDSVKQFNWSLQETLLQSDHIVAIATETNEVLEQNPFVFLDFDCLVRNLIPVISEDVQFTKNFMEKEEEPC